MAALPSVTVKLDDGSGTFPFDITQYVDLSQGIDIQRGRQDEFADVDASTCSLALDNMSGLFTPGVTALNLIPNPSFDTDASGWGGFVSTIARSTAQAWVGAASLLVTASGIVFESGAEVGPVVASMVPVTGSAPHSFQAQCLGVVADQAEIRVLWYHSTGTFLSEDRGTTTAINASTWTRITATLTSPSNASYARIRIVGTRSSGLPFSSSQVMYIDAAMAELGSSPSTYSGYQAAPSIRVGTPIRVTTNIGASSYNRFTGFVNQWPIEWPGGNKQTFTQITASDAFARLSRQTFRSPLEQTVMSDGPSLYYVLGESDGATSAGDSSGNLQQPATIVQRGTGGTLEFGSGTGPGTDSNTAPVFTPASPTDGLYLSAPVSARTSFRDQSWMVIVNPTVTAAQTFLRWTDGDQSVTVGTDATGHLLVSGVSRTTTPTWSSTGAVVTTGATHVIVISVDASSNMVAYLDGSSTTHISFGGAPVSFDTTQVYIGGGPTSNLATATISHVAMWPWSLIDPVALTNAAANGFTADSTDERVARYADWAGIPTALQSLEAGDMTSVSHLDTAGTSASDAMKQIASSEGGLLFVDGSGVLTFHSRSHRYAPTSAVTLQASDLGGDTRFVLDDQGLINIATASRPNGATQLVRNAASISKYRDYPGDVSTLATTDDEALQAANWLVSLRSEPLLKITNTTVDVLTLPDTGYGGGVFGGGVFGGGASGADLQALELGDLITLSDLPSPVPTSTLNLFVEGWTEHIGTTWSMNLNTSAPVTVWIVEDPVYGQVDNSNLRVAY